MNFKVITGYPVIGLRILSGVTNLKIYKNTNIGACCNGKMKRAYGFIWRYIE